MALDEGKVKYLKDRISSRLPKLLEIVEADFRKELDNRTHILDLSYESLKVNVYRGSKLSTKELEVYNRVYETLQKVVRESIGANKTFSSLDADGFIKLFTAKKAPGAILIDNGPNHFFIVGKSFDAVRNFVSKYVSSNPQLKATRFGEYTREYTKTEKTITGKTTLKTVRTTRSKVDIGHISTQDNPNLQSPLESKIQSVVDFASSIGNKRIASIANTALRNLYRIQAEFAYSFKNTAPEAIATARKVLGTGYIVVTLHTERKNNNFSIMEKAVYDRLLTELALICSEAADFKSSNSIKQDIVDSIAKIYDPSIKVQKHTQQTGKISKTIKISPKSVQPIGSLNIRLPAPQQEEVNIISLQNLINASLHDQIRKNMGKGERTDVLNYRTGRFARSAEVNRMTMSREGAITAFYTYMKNPYATFSEGGQQSRPRTRDPKLLISKSIRELAATRVANRLRAVVV